MKSDQILDAVGLIAEEAVLDAREYRRPRSRRWVKPCAVAAAALLLSSTAMAAWMFLRPAQVPEQFHDYTLSGAFDSEDAINISASAISGDYTFTLMAIVSGAGISDYLGSAAQVQPERTYVVLAIQNADGSPIPEEQEFDITNDFMVTPLIQGLEPWRYNIASMGGSFSQALVDGVVYRLAECDSIMAFADRRLYVGVCESPFVMLDTFRFDEDTGEIAVNPEFQGASAVFELPVDPSCADPEAAEEYLKLFEERMQPAGGSAGAQTGAADTPQSSPEVSGSAAEWEDRELRMRIPPGLELSPEEQERVNRMEELFDSADWEGMTPVEDSYQELTPDAQGMIHYDYSFEDGRHAGFTALAGWYFEGFKHGKTAFYHKQGDIGGDAVTVWAVRLTKLDDSTLAAVVVAPE